MRRYEDERWPEQGGGDRGGAARHPRQPEREAERWPDRGNGDRVHGADYEGGYGGGRERGEQWPEHGFGDRGWGGGRGGPERQDTQRNDTRDRPAHYEYPEGAHPVPDRGNWDERYARENRDKYGQSGGQPIVQRGSGQSMGGYEHREAGLGSTRDVSARGGYGIRETERWPAADQGRAQSGSRNFAGKGPKNWRRSDESIADEINRRLTDHPDIDATEIDVVVKDAEVTLNGTVEERRDKQLAEDIAYSISGVADVHNRLKVMAHGAAGMQARNPNER